MAMKDTELDNLEKLIPSLATGAVKKAYLDALSSGNSVLEVIDGVLYEVFANGTKKKIKNLPPTIEVEMGKKIQL
jgi:hypothetical protein